MGALFALLAMFGTFASSFSIDEDDLDQDDAPNANDAPLPTSVDFLSL